MKKHLIFILGVLVAIFGFGVHAYASQTVDENQWTTMVSNQPLFGTSTSIGGSLLAAGGCTSGATTVTGATSSMEVVVTPTTYPGDGVFWNGYVSSANTITVKVCEVILGTPTASTYNLMAIQ